MKTINIKPLSVNEFKRITKKSKSTNKYKNSKITTDYGVFDSKGEYNRYVNLLLLEKTGHIKDLKRQVRFELVPKSEKFRKVEYIADFFYVEAGNIVVEDFKNPYLRKNDKSYIIKKKLMYSVHGIEIRETS